MKRTIAFSKLTQMTINILYKWIRIGDDKIEHQLFPVLNLL